MCHNCVYCSQEVSERLSTCDCHWCYCEKCWNSLFTNIKNLVNEDIYTYEHENCQECSECCKFDTTNITYF